MLPPSLRSLRPWPLGDGKKVSPLRSFFALSSFRPSDVPGGPPRANFLQPHLRLHHRVAERAHQEDQELAEIDEGGRDHEQDIRQVSNDQV